jgi:hypothetical protein
MRSSFVIAGSLLAVGCAISSHAFLDATKIQVRSEPGGRGGGVVVLATVWIDKNRLRSLCGKGCGEKVKCPKDPRSFFGAPGTVRRVDIKCDGI